MVKLFKASALFLFLLGTSSTLSAQDLVDWGIRVAPETKTEVTSTQNTVLVNVYNAKGQVVLTQETKNLNLATLRPGSYTIVTQEGKKQVIEQFIKE